MAVSPALPWTAGTTGGTIRLKEPVTFNDLLQGALQFGLNKNGSTIIAEIRESSGGLSIGYVDRGALNVIYTIPRFEGETTELTIERLAEESQGYALNIVYVAWYGSDMTDHLLVLKTDGEVATNGEEGFLVGSLEDGSYIGFTQDGINAIYGVCDDQEFGDFVQVTLDEGLNANSVLSLHSPASWMKGKLAPVYLSQNFQNLKILYKGLNNPYVSLLDSTYSSAQEGTNPVLVKFDR